MGINKLSVVLATYNEELNLKRCLVSIKDIADEIIIVDGGSSDATIDIANSFKVKIIRTTNPPIFHINKQKALELAKYKWILQLDADEEVSEKLKKEISEVINFSDEEVDRYQNNLINKKLFLRHQKILNIGEEGGRINGYFIPRSNYFLGKFLKYGGVYPDGVIRLVRNGFAKFPCLSVHEQIEVQGRVGWLQNDLLHYDSPTFNKYLMRNSKYIDLMVSELKSPDPISYCLIKPIYWFFWTQVRHKGILDGWRGIVFSFFSALRFPRAYLRYVKNK